MGRMEQMGYEGADIRKWDKCVFIAGSGDSWEKDGEEERNEL